MFAHQILILILIQIYLFKIYNSIKKQKAAASCGMSDAAIKIIGRLFWVIWDVGPPSVSLLMHHFVSREYCSFTVVFVS